MKLNNVGTDHEHDADFFIDRPDGSGDNLLLILKSDAIFTLNGNDVFVPAKSFFIYPKGMPQYYRCVPKSTFSNDWLHFDFEDGEAEKLRDIGIPFAEPVSVQYTEFYSFCIRSIADENSAGRLHSADSINHYFWLMCNKVSEQIHENTNVEYGTVYEMLLTVRNMVYANPFWWWSPTWGAHQTRMSISSFHSHYKKQFGVTFMDDVITARIEYAKMLLRTTDMSVHDISMQCGYRSYEHFARQFRRECGMSPTEFRK